MRRFSYLLLAACLCLPMVGCGGGEADKPETPNTPAAGEGSGGDGGSAEKPADPPADPPAEGGEGE